MLLQGKKALITGASRGIGRKIAEAYAREGAELVLTARTVEALDDSCKAVRDLGRQAHALAWDIADISQIDERLNQALEALGGLDILVNNAGVVRLPESAEDKSPRAAYDHIMDINMRSLYFLCESAGKIMSEQGHGIIVNLASDAGMRAATNPYCISKWGVVGYTKGLAKRLAKSGVRVNAVAPGPVATAMMGCQDGDPKEHEGLPLGRFSLPEEVADVALFLASDMSRAVFGESIVVNSANG
ncbi:MAG: SDR family NAD(P)-dependent oxidoreductase [Candidatus Sumerlaeia bacterium]